MPRQQLLSRVKTQTFVPWEDTARKEQVNRTCVPREPSATLQVSERFCFQVV